MYTTFSKYIQKFSLLVAFVIFFGQVFVAHAAVSSITLDPVITTLPDSATIKGVVSWGTPADFNTIGAGNYKLFVDIGDSPDSLPTRQGVDITRNILDNSGLVEKSEFTAVISGLDFETEYFVRFVTPEGASTARTASFTTQSQGGVDAGASGTGTGGGTGGGSTTTTVTPSADFGNYDATDKVVHMSGGLVHGELLDSVGVIYGVNKNALTTATEKVKLTAGTTYFSVDITNVSPDTKYFFNFVGDLKPTAADPVGKQVNLSSQTKSFKTAAKGSGNPILVDALDKGAAVGMTDLTRTTASIIGTVSSAKTKVDIYFDALGTGKDFKFFFSPTIGSDLRFKEPITGLTPGTTYNLYLTKAGEPKTFLTGWYSFLTPNVELNPIFKTIEATKVELAVTTRASEGEGMTQPRIVYGESPTDITYPIAILPGGDGTYSVTIEGLKPDTTYYYRIEGGDRNNPIIYYGAHTFLTAVGTPTDKAPTIKTLQGGAIGKLTGFTGKLIPCSGVEGAQQTCNFAAFIKLLNNIINFLLFVVAPIIATSLILYGGFLILTAGDSSEKVTQAKGLFMKGIVGLVIAMSAWLIVKFVLVNLGYDSTIFPTFY